MKAIYRTASGRLSFEIVGETQKSVFKDLAAIQDCFEAETMCGVCGSPNIRMAVRIVEKYEYYELHCRNGECLARFMFGQTREGGALFPKRKSEDGAWLANRGWSRYEPPKEGA